MVLLSGCGENNANKESKPIIYDSFYPVYDLAKDVYGDTVEIRTFMPIDKDPHLWEPTPKDIKKLEDADSLIVNGANMERWLPSIRKSLPNLKVLTLSDSVNLITYKGAAAIGDFQYMSEFEGKANKKNKIVFGHTHEDVMRVAFFKKDSSKKEKLIEKGKEIMEEKGKLIPQNSVIKVEAGKVYSLEMGHEKGLIEYVLPDNGEWIFVSDRMSENLLPYQLTDSKGENIKETVVLKGNSSGLDTVTYDPHSWLSLVNAKKYVNEIYNNASKEYQKNKRKYYNNKVSTISKLTDLEYEYKEKLKSVPNRDFVVTHYAYAYLARDFNLRQYPLQGLISTETPSLKTMRKAISFCKYKKINTIFYEEFNTTKGADILADEIGGKTEFLSSMEYMNSNRAENQRSYVDIMKDNLEKIYKSLKR